MAKTTAPRRDLHREITDKIIADLRAGVPTWLRPWQDNGKAVGLRMPQNAVSHRPYSGINILMLWSAAAERGFADPRWLTFKQALELGGNVRKGEKGNQVVFAKQIEVEDDKAPDGTRRVSFLKHYTVFNVSQCDGLGDAFRPVDAPADGAPTWCPDHERNELAEAAIAAIGADVRHGGNQAYYHRILDQIVLPEPRQFDDAGAYYATSLHEHIHWTGAPHRLDRTKGKRFGDTFYAFEELVAELGSAFVCAELGVRGRLQHAQYIAGWIKALDGDTGAIVSAASHASRAVAWIRDAVNAAPAELAAAA